MKRCLMITGGPLDLSYAKTFIENKTYDFVIAVDNGFAYCQELNLRPDLLVGDFDTFGRDRIQAYRKNGGYQIDLHQPEKDDTDTELAFRHAFANGCTAVDVLGALGGRIDHEISNIHLMVHEKKRGLSVFYYDVHNKIYALDAEVNSKHTFIRNQLYGKYISFLPITESVKGITLKGFRYPLEKKTITILGNPSLCVSNEVTEDEAELIFEEGILICVESRD